MANTYTQIHIQAVFAVSHRQALILPEWKTELYKFMTGIVKYDGHKLLAINGMPDHVHLFFGMRPAQSLSALMQKVKSDSSRWINERQLTPGRFSWQGGYGAFSYSKSHISRVCKYIENQEAHHRRKTFQEEYLEFLEAFEIKYDKEYLFKPI